MVREFRLAAASIVQSLGWAESVRNALVISGVAHALLWGLNAWHAPKPLAGDLAAPVTVEVVSADEIEKLSTPEKTDTAQLTKTEKADVPQKPDKPDAPETSRKRSAQSQPSPARQPAASTSPAGPSQAAPQPAPPAEPSAAPPAPSLAQADWKPSQVLPGGGWLESALASPIAAHAFDPSEGVANLSEQEIATLKARLKECWHPPAGLADAKNVMVMLRVSLAPNGALREEPSMIAASASEAGPVLMQTAKRALQQCQPFGFLPAAKYNEWKILDLNFAPTGLTTTRINPVL
jgi:hypothetical protein